MLRDPWFFFVLWKARRLLVLFAAYLVRMVVGLVVCICVAGAVVMGLVTAADADDADDVAEVAAES